MHKRRRWVGLMKYNESHLPVQVITITLYLVSQFTVGTESWLYSLLHLRSPYHWLYEIKRSIIGFLHRTIKRGNVTAVSIKVAS